MVTVDDYLRVRMAHRDGMGLNELARTFHHSKRKIQQILALAEPGSYPKRRPAASILDSFKTIIDAILELDEKAPTKQRHTASKMFRRLRDEYGYRGSAERVRLYIRLVERRQVETFVPLSHDPGQRVEADFGHIYADFPGGRKQVPVLLTTWGYSNYPFAIALPTERTEAVLHGLVEAFSFFGCVPRELWWDNPKTVAPLIYKGRERGLQPRYAALASHYLFEPLFCMVRTPQEKPRVEGRVRFLQRDWATPVPQVKDLGELNAWLVACCRREAERTQAGQTETIGQRFGRDRDKAWALPARPFDACILQPAQVDKYQTARFDHNCYSVPRPYAFTTVMVKGYVHEVVITAGDQVIARHARSYERGVQVLEPRHYLAALGRRPAALDHADVFRHWQLPAIFAELRKDLERQHGGKSGARHFIRVLQLLAHHPLARVQRAVEMSRTSAGFRIDAILQRVQHGATNSEASSVLPAAELPALAQAVQVPLPDLRRFDQLLSLEVHHERRQCVADQGQPEATASADHACRV